MDKVEAAEILSQEMDQIRTRNYTDLQLLMGSPIVIERKGLGGVKYQIEVEAFLDNPRESAGDLRVIASIDDGGFFSSLIPLSADFIITRQGKFIDE